MEYVDKMLVCMDCQAEFVHSATDQQRFAERGFTNEPKRCPTCRDKRKATGGTGPRSHPRSSPGGGPGGGGGDRPPRKMYSVTCADCGKPTQVPFKPTEGRPVYCRDCYASKRS